MPYEGDVAAFWALVGDDVEFRSTPFDVERAAADISASDWPIAEEFVSGEPARARRRAREAIGMVRDRVADRVPVGRVGKPHGIAGAFFVEDASDDPERFAVGARAASSTASGPRSSSRSARGAGR